MIYSQTTLGGNKNTQTTINYYFSCKAESQVYPLSKPYLKLEFLNNIRFLELLDIYFRTDDELTQFNEVYKNYTLNYVLQLSLN